MYDIGSEFRTGLRKLFPGGRVPLYRGVPGSTSSTALPLQSYSLDPTVAYVFAGGLTQTGRRSIEGGTVVRELVPIKHIVHGFDNGEFEMLVLDPPQLRTIPGFPLRPER
jgi:hypothetical protein